MSKLSMVQAADHLNIKLGQNTIPNLSSTAIYEFPHFSTGSFVIDWVTGIGGAPRGRITELHGMHGSGKSTTALMIAAEAQQANYGVLYLDYEHAVDVNYAKVLGVKIDPALFAINQPNTLEDGLRIAEYYMLNVDRIGVIIVDSVAAMSVAVEKGENAEIGESQLGSQARVLSIALRQLKALIHQSQVAWVFINQLRDVIDISWAGQQRQRILGPQKTTPGGNALKFYADLRLEYIPKGADREEQVNAFSVTGDKEKVVIGQKVRVTAVKNKCATPFKSGEIYIRHGLGIDSTMPCVNLAIHYGIIRVSGKNLLIPAPFCSDDKAEMTISTSDVVKFYDGAQAKLQSLFDVVSQKMRENPL